MGQGEGVGEGGVEAPFSFFPRGCPSFVLSPAFGCLSLCVGLSLVARAPVWFALAHYLLRWLTRGRMQRLFHFASVFCNVARDLALFALAKSCVFSVARFGTRGALSLLPDDVAGLIFGA